MMRKYEHVEDYLEVVAGLRDPDTLKPSGLGWFSPILSLARYDVSVFNSMSETTINGGSLTEKQGRLLVKLLDKYRRQLSGLGIDSHEKHLTKFRNRFRVVNETRSMGVIDDLITIKFPFESQMIDQLREFAKESQGKCRWNRDSKVWLADLTEYNVNWLVTWGRKNSFLLEKSLMDYMDLIEELGKQTYKIELTVDDTGTIVIDNAPRELISYVNEVIGELTIPNLAKLIDYAPSLGYSVSEKALGLISDTVDKDICKMFLTKEIIIEPSEDAFLLIKNYAEASDRWPITVVNSALSSNILDNIYDKFQADEVEVSSNQLNRPTDPRAKVFYTTRPVIYNIPLLVTTSGIITGSNRQMMLQSAEKVVFLSAGVYNRKRKPKVSKLK